MKVQKSKDNTFPLSEGPDEICKTCNQNHRHVQSFDDVKTSIDHLDDLLKRDGRSIAN